MGDMSVSKERDVRDRVIVDEEVVLRQMSFHDSKRGPAAGSAKGKRRDPFRGIRLVL